MNDHRAEVESRLTKDFRWRRCEIVTTSHIKQWYKPYIFALIKFEIKPICSYLQREYSGKSRKHEQGRAA